MEYHSESGSELEMKQIIFVSPDEEFMFLNIQFPLPFNFPKPYLVMNEVMSNLDDALPKPYVREHSITKNPDNALSYIITHFNIDEVFHSIREFPRLKLEQVYYLTYIDTSLRQVVAESDNCALQFFIQVLQLVDCIQQCLEVLVILLAVQGEVLHEVILEGMVDQPV